MIAYIHPDDDPESWDLREVAQAEMENQTVAGPSKQPATMALPSQPATTTLFNQLVNEATDSGEEYWKDRPFDE